MISRYILRMAESGSKTAFIEQGLYRSRAFSYAEVLGRAQAFAVWLESKQLSGRGASDPPRIMIWGRPGAHWAMAFYGCVLAGSVVVPVDAGFSADFVCRVAARTRASLLIGDSETARALDSSELSIERFELAAIENLPAKPKALGPELSPDPNRLVEIVFTSGTTSQPRGVMITHGNLLANLEPIDREIRRYWPISLPFRPLRFVNLIPLSHLFGQVMGLFIPQLLRGVVIFPESQSPVELARTLKSRRVSVMVCVPQQLEAMGAWALAQLDDGAEAAARARIEKSLTENWGVLKRWWRFRRLHRRLGWKMWAFVTGGARLPARVESLWNALGYAMIQGYGLTETAPAITITHPFKARRGAVGRPLPGAETKIAEDGEILVRGANVSPGYYGDPEATREAFSGGWLRTGDLGRFDEEGNLIYLGRKKEVIVTAEGLNVFPEDVERALAAQPAVRESAAVGKESEEAGSGPADRSSSRTLVHAVIVPAAGADAGEIDSAVAQANRSLEPHQRIRGFSLWPGRELPRTASTGKIQRAALAAWVNDSAGVRPTAQAERRDWRNFLESLGVPAERIRSEARLTEDLGLSSLDRVELMTWIESQGYAVEEDAIAAAVTVADLEAALSRAPSQIALKSAAAAEPAQGAAASEKKLQPAGQPSLERAAPRWPVAWPARAARELAQRLAAIPLLWYYIRLERRGLEKLASAPQPAIFVSNHQSFFDAPLIFRALPPKWRRRVAPAMSEEELTRHSRFSLFLTRLIFNGYLISGNPARAHQALRHAGWLAERGFSTLIFPEGDRTWDGKLQRFRPGVGVMAERLKLPVITVRLEGLFELWPRTQYWPKHGEARVTFGDTFRPEPGESPSAFVVRLENYYRNWPQRG
jgi:long-chain acyl-CoA synthetase